MTNINKNLGFFAVDLNQARAIHAAESAEALFTYLVVACHTDGKRNPQHTRSRCGAKAVHVYAGLSYRTAQKELLRLCDNGYLAEAADATSASKSSAVRYLVQLSDSPDWAYLPKSLVQGLGHVAKSPLRQIWENGLSHRPFKPGARSTLAKDSLLVLLHCYKDLHFVDFGGIDSSALLQDWEPVDAPIKLGSVEGIQDVCFRAFRKKGPTITNKSWVERIFDLPCEDVKEDFWAAVRALREFGLLYECVMIFDESQGAHDALPEFCFWVHDEHAEKNGELSVGRMVNRLVARYMVDVGEHDSMDDAFLSIAQRDQIWVPEGFTPRTVFRPRYRPSTRDVGEGLALINERTAEWRERFRQIGREEEDVW